MTDGDIVVVDDGILLVFLREPHLRIHRIMLVCILAMIGIFYLQTFVSWYILVVEMQLGKCLSCLVEIIKGIHVLYDRNAWETLLQVCLKSTAILRRVQESVDIIEYHFLVDALDFQATTYLIQYPVADAIMTNVLRLRIFIKE